MSNEGTMLSQEEIDVLLHAAREKRDSAAVPIRKTKRIFRCIFGPSTRITRQQSHLIDTLHETFARRLSMHLGGLLRTTLDVRMAGIEELPFSKLLNQVQRLTYWASVKLQPLGAMGALNLDLGLVFPMLDLLFGGDGNAKAPARDVTEVEGTVIEIVVAAVCDALEAAWQPVLDLKFSFDRRQGQTQIVRLIPASEKVLWLSFELGLPTARGAVNLAFPAEVTGLLLKKIDEQWLANKRRPGEESKRTLRERLKLCRFTGEMVLPNSRVRGQDLMDLEAGHVLLLENPINDPAHLSIAGKTMFDVYPVRVGNARAAKIHHRISVGAQDKKELQ